MAESTDERILRLAIALAREARQAGEDPFGALLVKDGEVVAQTRDRTLARRDPTQHAELSLISDYCRAAGLFSLAGHTLYSSAEPCPMCAGAIHWARVSRVVFSVSQEMLQQISGGNPKPACETILAMCGRKIEVVGPLLPEEGLAVFEDYVFVPKASRVRGHK